MEYRKRSHNVHLLTYHMILVTKYRKPVLNEAVSTYLKQRLKEMVKISGGELLSVETDFDHIHFLVSLSPDKAPGNLLRGWKSTLAREIHQKPELMEHVGKYLFGKNVGFWSGSYFVATTGSVSLETVKQYIESQQTDEHRQKRKYVWSGKYKEQYQKQKKRQQST